ncbi:hypothetical protein SRABI70_02941 [Pseudomonas sp. Bi70]|uniref:DUF3298 and DUF4163 domain-containing protein n=1 Tax=Pseudomonas sp. Bi70 TaxID=2821127 RepID=UPI001DD73D32|nr:DUF3298 and DUF4163 domain-containing protein [Pseudomonas sp. Bi70]CAH0249966.1 hypothetical protein SRABI70_02941 [Pseudomonas sp. Bi70]
MKISSIARLATILGFALLLGACQSLSKPDTPAGVATTHEKWEHKPADCTAQDCPLVNVELQEVSGQPELNARIEATLLDLVKAATGSRPASLAEHEREFLANGKPGWASYLQAKVLSQHDQLVVIELSSYHFIGGAHGVPGRTYINYDREQNKVLSLQDMLVPGEEAAFWQIAQRAHQAWLISQGHGNDVEYRKTWPFERTANIALNPNAVMLKYDVARLAPYSDGHPEILIPYSQLQGILRPAYMPGATR